MSIGAGIKAVIVHSSVSMLSDAQNFCWETWPDIVMEKERFIVDRDWRRRITIELVVLFYYIRIWRVSSWTKCKNKEYINISLPDNWKVDWVSLAKIVCFSPSKEALWRNCRWFFCCNNLLVIVIICCTMKSIFLHNMIFCSWQFVR